MAFNPLEMVRENSKVVMAGITMVAMFVFVLTFGQGDILNTLTGGAGADRGPEVTKLFGKTVYKADVQKVRENFNLAEFLRFGYSSSLNASQRRESDAKRPRFLSVPPQSLDESVDQLIWAHQAEKLGIRLDEAAMRKIFNEELATPSMKDPWPEGMSFEELPYLKTALQFAQLNRRVATPKDIKEALRSLMTNMLAREVVLGQSTSGLFQMMMGGGAGGVPSTTLSPTPEEFHRFYERNLTRVAAVVQPLPIPAVDAKGQTVSDKEIQDFFDRYKDQEPVPGSAFPGFKTPQMYKLSWAAAREDSPLVKAQLPMLQALRVWAPAQVLAQSLAGGAAASALGLYTWSDTSSTGLPVLTDDSLPGLGPWIWLDPQLGAFERRDLAAKIAPFEQKRHDAAYQKTGTALEKITPELVVGVVGLGQANQHAAAVAMVAAGPDAIARFRRVKQAATAALLGSGNHLPFSPLGATPSPGKLAAEETVASQIAPEVLAASQKSAFDRQIASFTEFLSGLRGAGGIAPKDAAAAEAKAKDRAAALGFAYSASGALQDVGAIEKDAATQPLVVAYQDSLKINNPDKEVDRPFADYLRQQVRGVFQASRISGRENSLTPDPAKAEKKKEVKPEYLFWASEEQPSRPRTLDEVKPMVVNEILLRRQVREVRRKAKEYQDFVKTCTGGKPVDIVTGEQCMAKLKEKFPELKSAPAATSFDGKSNLQRAASFSPAMAGSYEQSRIPLNSIRYPRPESLLLLADADPGNAIVLADNPGTSLYLALVTSKVAPSDSEFKAAYQGASKQREMNEPDNLYQRLTQATNLRYEDMLMQDLRRQATGADLDSQGLIMLKDESLRRNPD